MFVTEATQCSVQSGLQTRKPGQNIKPGHKIPRTPDCIGTPIKPVFVTEATQCSVQGGLQTRKLGQDIKPGHKIPRTPDCIETPIKPLFVTEATQCSFQGGLQTRKLSQFETPLKSVNDRLQTRKLSQSPPPVKRVIHSAKSPKKSMIPVRISESKEVGIQTGGILTVRQKSTQNYIPKGRHQLQRSPSGRKRQNTANSNDTLTTKNNKNNNNVQINIEVKHNNDKVSRMNLSGTEISLRIQPERSRKTGIIPKYSRKHSETCTLRKESRASDTTSKEISKKPSFCRSKIQRLSTSSKPSISGKPKSSPNLQNNISDQKKTSEEKYFKSILEKKTLQPIKTTSLGVLLVLVDK